MSKRAAGAMWLFTPWIVTGLLSTTAAAQSPPPAFFAATLLSFDAGLNPRSLSIGELNADGKVDLVTTHDVSSANTVSVLLGHGEWNEAPHGPPVSGDQGGL